MNNKLLFFIFLCLVLTLSSCSINFITSFNKDGSGQKSLEMDLSKMNAIMSMMVGSEEEMPEDSVSTNENETDPMGMANLFDPDNFEYLDTTISFFGAMPDSLKNESTEFLKDKVYMNIDIDKSVGKIMYALELQYEDQNELSGIFNMLDTMQLDQSSMFEDEGSDFIMDLFRMQESSDLRKGIIMMPEYISEKDENEDESDATMKAMLFGDSKLMHTYILPNDVEFVNDPKATITGNKVSFEVPFSEFFLSGKIPA